jgi:deoxyribose-phosphate aldolase
MIKLESMIDHTLLKPDARLEEINKLCQDAAKYNFKSVCVNPTHIATAVKLLANSDVHVGTVCGFPLGGSITELKVYEAETAENLGASEIDMVANIGAIKDGCFDLIRSELIAVRQALTGTAILKVILECTLLSNEQIQIAAAIASECGVDFVKTSTGFFGGATVEHVTILYNTVGKKIGVKASGGIRDVKTVLSLIEAGASRIGTSAGVEIIEEYKNGLTR